MLNVVPSAAMLDAQQQMPWLKTGEILNHAQLKLPEKGRTIKGWVVCNDCDLEPFDLLKSLALGRNQSTPLLLFVWFSCTDEWKHPKCLKASLFRNIL